MMFFNVCHKCNQKLLKLRPICGKSVCRRISVVFYGSDEFSLETIKLLNENFSKTETDKKLIKRLDVVLSSKSNLISRFAVKNQLKTYDFPYELPANVYDIGVVSSFGHLIPKRAINACRLGMLNIHGSLLPRWRGAAPVNYAVLNDDKITGITVMRIKPKKFDIGDIVLQYEHKIKDRITAKQLKSDLAPIGAQLLWKCLSDLDNCFNKSKPQPNEGITYAPKFDETYGLIDWSSMTAIDIDRRFRAFIGFIDIYTHWINGTPLRLNDIIDPELVAQLDLNRLSGCSQPKPGFVFYHKKRRILCISSANNTWSAFGSLALKGHKLLSAHQFNNGFLIKLKGTVILGQNNLK